MSIKQMLLSWVIILSVSLVVEFSKVYEKEYISECCSSSYHEITSIDKYNKEKTRNYCLECKKWCNVTEKG